MLFCLEKTRAPEFFAISPVLSEEPQSTTMISSAQAELCAAQTLLENEVWNAFAANLTPVPSDAQTVRAIVVTPEAAYTSEALERMGKAFHKNYLKISGNRIPDNMKPWKTLEPTLPGPCSSSKNLI